VPTRRTDDDVLADARRYSAGAPVPARRTIDDVLADARRY
jgi:hypothetical protein